MSITTSRRRLLNFSREFSETKSLKASILSGLSTLFDNSSKSRPIPFSDVIIGSNTVDKISPNFANFRKCSSINE